MVRKMAEEGSRTHSTYLKNWSRWKERKNLWGAQKPFITAVLCKGDQHQLTLTNMFSTRVVLTKTKALRLVLFFLTVLKLVSDGRGEENGELPCFLPASPSCAHFVERRIWVWFCLAG